MKKIIVYDYPMRAFHWIFAALFVTAFLIAKTLDDDSPIYAYHMLAGLLLSFTVIMRIVWGFIGTQHSRFSNFALKPSELVSYFKGILSGDKRKWAGHNPASSWASIGMFILALGLGATGLLMASGQKEAFEDVHELLANGFLVLVLMHIAGIALHTIRHRDPIAFSMLNGQKTGISEEQALQNPSGPVAMIFIGLVLAFAVYLGQNYNSQTQSLKIFGNNLQLGESRSETPNQYDGDHTEDDE